MRDISNFVLVCKKISPRHSSDKIKVFFSTVVNWRRLMNNLLTIVLKNKWMTINDKGHPFLKKTIFKKPIPNNGNQEHKPYQITI